MDFIGLANAQPTACRSPKHSLLTVTRSTGRVRARFKTTSEVDGGSNQVPTNPYQVVS